MGYATAEEPRASNAGDDAVRVELQQTDHDVVVTMALGWVVHGSIAVHCAGRTLRVEAERCGRPSDPGGRGPAEVLRREVALPCAVSSHGARARYRRGELVVQIPKAATAPHA